MLQRTQTTTAAVEGCVSGREGGGIAVHDLDRHGRRRRALEGDRPGRGVRLDSEHRGDPGRVVLEGAPVAAAELEHATTETGEEPAPELPGDRVRAARLPPFEVAREARLL
jgi:hypothetical protein